MFKRKLLFLIGFMMLGICLYAQAQDPEYAVIGASDVKMRSEASSSAQQLGIFQLGEIAQILDKSDFQSVAGIEEKHQWYKLKIGNKTGWVYGAFVFEATKVNDLSLQNEDLELYQFTKVPLCDMDACNITFFGIIPGTIEDAKKIRFIKDSKGYRGMLSLEWGIHIQQSFVDKNNNIVLYSSGEYILLSQATIYELKWTGTEYTSTLKYFKSYK